MPPKVAHSNVAVKPIPRSLMSCTPPSRIDNLDEVIRICTISQNPTRCIAQAADKAIEYITPMQAPNSGPRERDIIKYVPPSFNTPFVLIADIDKAVIVAMAQPNNMITIPETDLFFKFQN